MTLLREANDSQMPPKQQTVTLSVPKSFSLPAFYLSAEPKDVAEALVIGSALLTTVRTASTDSKIKEIEEQKKRDILTIQEESKRAVDNLTESLQTTEQTLAKARLEKIQQIQAFEQTIQEQLQTARTAERDQTTKQYEGKLRDLEQQIATLSTKNDAYLARKLELESNRDRDIQAAEESTRRSITDLLHEKDRSLKQAREDLDATHSRNERAVKQLQDLLHIQTEEIRNLRELLIKRAANAKSKGNDFEDAFRRKLILAFGTSEQFSLEDSAKNGFGHAADFIMNWKDHKILWETKEYDKTVPDEEVKKLKRDLKENTEATIGVMVSRYTGIVGKTSKGDLYYEFVEGKMLLYISNFDKMSEEILPLLLILFKMYWKYGQTLEEDEGKIDAIREIEKLNKIIDDRKKEWRVHKAHQDAATRFTSEFVEEMEHKVRFLLNDLQGNVEKVKDIPNGMFREDSLRDEVSLKKIHTILACTEYNPSGSVELNKLADAYSKANGSLSRDTAKSHIRGVLLDTSLQQNKGSIPIKVLGLVLLETQM